MAILLQAKMLVLRITNTSMLHLKPITFWKN